MKGFRLKTRNRRSATVMIVALVGAGDHHYSSCLQESNMHLRSCLRVCSHGNN